MTPFIQRLVNLFHGFARVDSLFSQFVKHFRIDPSDSDLMYVVTKSMEKPSVSKRLSLLITNTLYTMLNLRAFENQRPVDLNKSTIQQPS